MTYATSERFAPFDLGDRNFFLLILAAIWAYILAGFAPDIFDHVSGKHVAYALVVHIHAVVFVGWLALLTTQMSLIRAGRADLHRRLGLAGGALIPAMAVLGPWTVLVMAHREFGTPDGDAAFIILPFLNILNFTVVASAGLALRRTPAAHKRLMILATVLISDAGFARWLGGPIAKLTGTGVLPFFVQNYTGTVILIAAMAAWKPIATALIGR